MSPHSITSNLSTAVAGATADATTAGTNTHACPTSAAACAGRLRSLRRSGSQLLWRCWSPHSPLSLNRNLEGAAVQGCVRAAGCLNAVVSMRVGMHRMMSLGPPIAKRGQCWRWRSMGLLLLLLKLICLLLNKRRACDAPFQVWRVSSCLPVPALQMFYPNLTNVLL